MVKKFKLTKKKVFSVIFISILKQIRNGTLLIPGSLRTEKLTCPEVGSLSQNVSSQISVPGFNCLSSAPLEEENP